MSIESRSGAHLCFICALLYLWPFPSTIYTLVLSPAESTDLHFRPMNRRLHLFSRVWAVLAIALIAVTWKLWTPQTSFPQIPFCEFLIHAPRWIDWIALAIVGLSLLACLFLKPRVDGLINTSVQQNPGSGLSWFRMRHLWFSIAFALLILLDQNRLQPWAYHFVIIGLLIGLASPAKAISLIRLLAISIYIYSAISKFDYQFVHTVGDQMLSTILGFAGIETTNWSQELKSGLVLLLPTGELLVGIGLAIPRFRAFATVAAVGLHVALLVILGPWGLAHRPGVLIWNLFFISQALILFWQSKPSIAQLAQPNHTELEKVPVVNPSPQSGRLPNHLAQLVAILALCFPLTQWIGICDHWPAWQVYSPSSSRAQLLNDRSASQWSLEELGVPIYPQARFQLAVASAAAEKSAKQNQHRGRGRFQIELRNQSNRFTGERTDEILTGADQFKMKKSRFWLNTRARKIWFD